MKKLFSLFLALLMLLGLSACKDTSAVSPAPSPSAAPTPVPTSVPTVQFVIPKLGTVTGTEYRNDFLGIRCTLDAGWSFFSEEEIAEINQITVEAANQDVAAAIRSASIITDMAAQNVLTGSSVNINLEDIGHDEEELSTELYLASALGDLSAALTDMGVADVTAETADIPFLGRDTQGFRVHCTVQGADVYEVMVFLRFDRYLATVTATAFAEDTTADILGFFSPLS